MKRPSAARLLLLALVTLAPAARATQDFVPGSRYTSGRGEAMAGAFMPLADDGVSGLFYTPAAIAKITKPTYEALNLQLKTNNGFIGGLNRDFFKVTSLSAYKDRLQSRENELMGIAGTASTGYSMKGFAFGLLVSSDLNARHEPGHQVRSVSKYQIIPAAGFGLPLARGIVRLGYSVQWVNEAKGQSVASDTNPELGYNDGLAQGTGFSHNFGFALSLPVGMEPSFDLVVRNIGGLKYYTGGTIIPLATNPSGEPEDEPMTVDAAFALRPRVGSGGRMTLVAEWRDMTNQSGLSILGRAAVGLEMGFRDRFFVRAGWGRGYPALGFGLKRESGELSLAVYSEELGTSYHGLRDGKFLIHYRINAF